MTIMIMQGLWDRRMLQSRSRHSPVGPPAMRPISILVSLLRPMGPVLLQKSGQKTLVPVSDVESPGRVDQLTSMISAVRRLKWAR